MSEPARSPATPPAGRGEGVPRGEPATDALRIGQPRPAPLSRGRQRLLDVLLRLSSVETRPPRLRYGIAVLTVTMATVLQVAVRPLLRGSPYFSLYYPAVLVSAVLGGLGPGLLATLLSALLGMYFFIDPFAALMLVPGELARALLFAASAGLITLVAEALHTTRRRLAAAAAEATDLAREEAELAARLEAESARISAVVASVPGVVWEAWGSPDDRAQRIDFVSEHVERMVGYKVEDWLARPNFWLTIVHPEDKDRAAAEAAAIFAGGKGGESEFRWIARGGRVVHVDAHSRVIKDAMGRPVGMRGVTLDVSRRRKAEEAVRFLAEASRVLASSLEYETTLKTLAFLAVPEVADWCAVDVLDESGALQRLAVAHRDPLRLTLAHELHQRYPATPDADETGGRVLRTGRAELVTEMTEDRLARSARDGEHLRLLRELGVRSLIVVPLQARHRLLGVLTLATAESGRRYDDDDLAFAENLADRAAAAVDNARLYRAAQQANRLKDEFLATLSHELRTPLNAILGWAGLLRSGRLDAETSGRALETIERNARLQTQLIADVLDISRIVTGKLHLEVRAVDLAAVVEAALDTVRPASDAKGVRLQVILDRSAGPVSGDADRLQQVVWNLLSNAIKFTDRGGQVQVRLARMNSHVELAVADTGEGIAPEFLPHVFERFRQADASTTRAHGGLGLGLAIVRHIVELHGGAVAADSAGEGQGAVFTVTLPVMIVADTHRVPREPVPSEPVPEAQLLRGLHVLVVDDEEDARVLLSAILEQHGARVTACESAAAAREHMDRGRPDVLISDVEMPVEDGYTFLRSVRARKAADGGTVPAVALTAYARNHDRLRAFLAGFQIHLAKPADPRELLAAVASLVGRTGSS